MGAGRGHPPPFPEANLHPAAGRGGSVARCPCIHFGKEGHSLTDQDYADLAAKTDGFSGSDISGMVKQALMIPVKRIQKAEYFFIGKDNMYHPCGPNTFVGYERWSEA